ncbi:MAG TPA: HEAT repeat domain-containing protein [Streptosporangiaceae bacterium]
MPSFITVRLLLTVIVAGAVLAFGLLLLTVAIRLLRYVVDRRRAAAEKQVRPAMLEAIAGEGVDASLVAAAGAHGRAVERLAFGYLARVRGDGHDLLAGLLQQRGTAGRVLRASRHPGPNRRANAASRLGLIASAEAGQRLDQMATGDHSARVRIVAARGLGKTGTGHAASTLLSLLGPDGKVPEGVVASALLELGPEAVPALRAEVRPGRDAHRRALAADLLGLLDVMPAWEDLVGCLAENDLGLRLNAARALGRLGVPQAAAALSHCLAAGQNLELRAVAARSLGLIGSQDSTGPLAACLDDPDYWVAHNAAAALAALGQGGQQVLVRVAAGHGAGSLHAREALYGVRLTEGEPLPVVGVGR